MTTFKGLVDDVMILMSGYGLEQDRAAFLTAAVSTATQTVVTVDSTTDLSPGLAEIDDELIYIRTIDSATQFTVAPDGRGYRGTVPATHAVDARVTMSPVLPKGLVKRKINETITGVYPTLYGTASTTLTWDPVKATHAVPADVEDIIQVTYDELGPSGQWPRVNRWRLDTHPDTTEWPTGKTLSIWDSLWGVTSIRVVYQKQPTELSLDTDLLTASGLSATARSAIVAGAAWRLVSFMDASRLKVHTPSTDLMDEAAPIGSAVQVSSLLRRQYERELEEERQRQALRNVPVMHWQE